MLDDCKHKLQCSKCRRDFPQPTTIKSTSKPGKDGYSPANCMMLDGSNCVPPEEIFALSKGPILVEVRFNEEGTDISIWDYTDEGSDCLATMAAQYTDCLAYDAAEFYTDEHCQGKLPMQAVKNALDPATHNKCEHPSTRIITAPPDIAWEVCNVCDENVYRLGDIS